MSVNRASEIARVRARLDAIDRELGARPTELARRELLAARGPLARELRDLTRAEMRP